MKVKIQKCMLILLMAVASVATVAWAAGCRDACALDYEAALQGCDANYSEDPKNLSDCRASAKRDYEACLEDCKA